MAQVAVAHDRTFQMPPRSPVAPGTGPLGFIRPCPLPQDKVHGVSFFLIHGDPFTSLHVLQFPPGKATVTLKTFNGKKDILTREKAFLYDGPFVDNIFQDDKKVVENYYSNQGFVDTKVTGDVIWDKKNEDEIVYGDVIFNINQGYLNALQVSGREIEEIIDIARSNGALGAKLTGGGGGGAIIALCPDNWELVAKAIRAAGYQAMVADIK